MFLDLETWANSFFLTLPRLIGMTAFLPLFAPQVMPGIVRYGVLAGVALVTMPLAHAQLQASAEFAFMPFLLKETALGLLLGFVVSLPFRLPAMIGDFLDNQRGAGIAQLFDPAQGGQVGPLGTLFSQVYIAWFVVGGGLGIFYELVYRSYELVPLVNALPLMDSVKNLDATLFMELFGSLLGALVRLALLLAAPVMVMMLLLELSLGLMGRFAPQLNTFFLAMPLKSLAAMGMLIVYFGMVFTTLASTELHFAPVNRALEFFQEKGR